MSDGNGNDTGKGASSNSVHGVIAARRDRLGAIYMRQRPVPFDPAARFTRFQLAMVHGELDFASDAARLAAFMIAFDGIVVEEAVGPAIGGALRAFVEGDAVLADWMAADGRRDARELSAMTVSCLKECDRSTLRACGWKGELARSLRPIYGGEDPVGSLLMDATRWTSSHVMQTLVAHVTRLAPMTAPPRSALARRATGKAIVQLPSEVLLDEAATGFGNAMAGAFTSTGQDLDQAVLDALVRACRPRGGGSEGTRKRRMLQEVLDLVPPAVAAGPLTSIAVCWAIDFVESGTRQEHNVSVNTIRNYVPVIAGKLFPQIRGTDFLKTGSDGFAKLYDDICDAASPGMRRVCAAALRCWHSFLEGWLDVAPLTRRLSGGANDDVPPKANFVWAHEHAAIRDWLDGATIDERLVGQLRVAFAIGFSGRIRAREFLMLKLRHVDAVPEKEVATINLSRLPTMKSDSANRRLEIRDEGARTILQDWIDRRKREGALANDYLFGDPHDPGNVWRLGVFYALLNRLLKAVTGDDSVNFHTLSHSWLSIKGEAALSSGDIEEVRKLDVDVAMPGGHLSNHTSAIHYMHLFTRPLRKQLDGGIRYLALTSEVASRWCCVSAAALRKRVARGEGEARTVYWDAILSSRDVGAFEKVEAGIAMDAPTCPAILHGQTGSTFRSVLHALTDMAAGLDVGAVAMRCGQTVEWVGRVAQEAAAQLETLGLAPSTAWKRIDPSPERNAATLAKCCGGERGPIDFGRADQSKYSALVSPLIAGSDQDTVHRAHRAWGSSMRGGYLGLESAGSAGRVFTLLANAGVSSNVVAIAIAMGQAVEEPGNDRDDPGEFFVSNGASPDNSVPIASLEVLDDVRSSFELAFAAPPIEIAVEARRVRPSIYLVWSSGRIAGDPLTGRHAMPPPAAAGLSGFHALMLAAGVHEALGRCQRE